MNTLSLSFFTDLGEKFYDSFINKGRWQYIVNGLGLTLLITLVAVIIGIIPVSYTHLDVYKRQDWP